MKKKILMADDSPDIIDVLKERLEANNYEVFPVTDAKNILMSVKKYNPDIIVLDIVMPYLNGYEICQLLKNNTETANIPIILFTGKELEPGGIVKRCLDLGVDCHLLKPLDSSVLIKTIEELIRK